MITFRKLNVVYVGLLLFLVAMPLKANAVESKVALIHSYPVLGDVNTNIQVLEDLIEEAFLNDANIVVTPELATTGYCITREEVLEELGFTNPYPELDGIRDLTIAYSGYAVIGIAEVVPGPEQAVYNTAVIFGPDGLIKTQDKRSLPIWHDPGFLPFETITTPYGDIGVLVCADSWLPNWSRILTLDGADIVVTSANWWGEYDQEETWQIRAKENGVWFFTANRWGIEIDERYGEPYYTYDMNDAPSVVIDPDGNILQIYRAKDVPDPVDTILYQTVDIPGYRIGSTANPTYSVHFREPGAYGEIANLYYRRDLGYEPAPGLPPPGKIRIASMTYTPALSPEDNIATINEIWDEQSEEADILVLPGLGVSYIPVFSAIPDWYSASHWVALQNFVENNVISLLVTTVFEISDWHAHQSLLLVQPGMEPQLRRQIHDYLFTKESGVEPLVLDLLHARIGILTGHDALFPETSTHLAKSGIDLLLISSTAGISAAPMPFGYLWEVDSLKRMWKISTNHGFHLAASDWTGNGRIIESGGYYIITIEDVDESNPLAMLEVDTNTVRYKYLNTYYSYDLEALLDN